MEIWRRLAVAGPLLLLSCGGGPSPYAPDTGAEGAATGALKSGTHVFEEIASGVYFATGTGKVNVGSNAMVVVNEDDVLLVDSHITADAARELIASVAAITDKPIRYLVNSHFHFDHAHGNQEFPEGVEIIGHEYTRERLLGDVLNEPTYSVIGQPGIPGIRSSVTGGKTSRRRCRNTSLPRSADHHAQAPHHGTSRGAADAAKHHPGAQDDAPSGGARNRNPSPWTGPYRRGSGGLAAQGEGRVYGRPFLRGSALLG